MVQKISIAQITVGQRHRKDMGDLLALSDSINMIGLLQPIGVTSKMQLVWGERRLRACQMLNWKEIDAVVDPSLDDILRAMQAEEDENKCRLAFAQSERVAIADHIESIERQRAEERKKAAQAKPGDKLRAGAVPSRNGRDNLSPPIADTKNSDFATLPEKDAPDSQAVPQDRGPAREKIAAAVGMSHGTLTKARKVVAQGTPELVEAMDKGTASVNAAAQVASLPPAEQREIVAGGKDAIATAAAKLRPSRAPRHPGLQQVLERLDAIAQMHPTTMSLYALREALKDLRKELGALLA